MSRGVVPAVSGMADAIGTTPSEASTNAVPRHVTMIFFKADPFLPLGKPRRSTGGTSSHYIRAAQTDVYKRQPIPSMAGKYITQGVLVKLIFTSCPDRTDRISAVSYTHLDVYKRPGMYN